MSDNEPAAIDESEEQSEELAAFALPAKAASHRCIFDFFAQDDKLERRKKVAGNGFLCMFMENPLATPDQVRVRGCCSWFNFAGTLLSGEVPACGEDAPQVLQGTPKMMIKIFDSEF
jgi:hypothetical protein